MIPELATTEIFLRPGITDMRKQITGLSTIALEEMELDPLSGKLFLFCSRSRKILKCIYWDQNGFCLWMKRLEKEKFPWPENEKEAQKITEDELNMLLKGIDFFKAHKQIFFENFD